MGEIADRLDELTVRVSSPDRQITVAVDGYGQQVEISIDRHAFHRYRPGQLEHQLSQLGRLTYAAYRREREEIVDSVIERPLPDDMADLVGPRLGEYRRLLAAIPATGQSDGGEIRLTARGLEDWTVDLAPLPRQATTDEFTGWLQVAVARLLADHDQRASAAHQRVYGATEAHRQDRKGIQA